MMKLLQLIKMIYKVTIIQLSLNILILTNYLDIKNIRLNNGNYEILRDVTNEYYKEYPGYEKIEESKTTYYRYITNDMVLLDADGNIVTDNDYCKKSFCTVAYVTKKEEIEEETPNNPQTIDNISYYIILLLASLVGIIVTFKKKIYLVLSNRFKRR